MTRAARFDRGEEGPWAARLSGVVTLEKRLFGVIGYIFKKLDYPLAPLVLALVLGDLAENALRQSLIMSQGSLTIFVNRPIAGVITAVALFFLLMPVLTPWWRRLRGTAVGPTVPHPGH